MKFVTNRMEKFFTLP